MADYEYYIDYLKQTDRFPQSVYHRAKHGMVREALGSIPTGSRILDAGCGIGNVTKNYYNHFAIFGVDEQQSAINYCQQFCKGTYVKGDLYKIPFDDNFFDAILFLDAIEHLTQPVLALQELARVLKPGGIILICTMNYSSPLWFILEHTWHRFFAGPCKPYMKEVHPTHYTEELLRHHCDGLFEEVYLIKRIMNMELFYFGKKR